MTEYYPPRPPKPRRHIRYPQLNKFHHRMKRVAIASEFILMCQAKERERNG